jgi:CRISPR/Cas system-associated endoribonuclease Cas2
MIDQKGKISIGVIIMLLIVFYGGYVAVQFLSAGFTVSQIENEIQQALNARQGSDFTPEIGEKAIRDILDKNDVYYDEEDESVVVVTLDRRTFRTTYYVEFEIELNLIFTKKIKYVTIDKVLAR